MGELKQKTITSILWNGFNTISNRLLYFVVGVILARLLEPSDYGIIAMVTVFTAILQIFTDGGLGLALIRKQDRTDADTATVFWYNLAMCWFIYLIMFITAPFLADFYDMPVLTPLTRILTLNLLFVPLGNIQSTLMRADINFKTPTIIGFWGTVLYGIFAIVMAYQGFGVWSLVYSSLANSLFLTIANAIAVRWFPKCGFSWKSFHELFGYSSKLLASTILDRIYNNLSPLIVGKFYSAAKLGLYGRAQNWVALPSVTVTDIWMSVAFPTLSKLQNDTNRLCDAYRKILRMSAFIIFPLMFFLVAVADPLVRFVLTDKWEDCILLTQLLCFSAMWYPIHGINLNLLQVTGRSDLFLRLEVIKKIIGVSVLFITAPISLEAMCIGQIVSSFLGLFINTYYTGKFLSLGFVKQAQDWLPILINCVVMCVICYVIQYAFEPLLVKLIAATVVGVFYYLITGFMFKSPELKELISIIFKNK